MMQVGYDIKFPDPGTVDEMFCDVCSTKMKVRRNARGRRSFGHPMMGGSIETFDEFTCPHAGKDWHVQAIALMKLAEETPSLALEKIIRAELEEVINTQKATKKVSSLW